jgi:hypothetical protein
MRFYIRDGLRLWTFLIRLSVSQSTMDTDGHRRFDEINGMMQAGRTTMGILFRVLWQQAKEDEQLEYGGVDSPAPPSTDDYDMQTMCDALDVMLPRGKTTFCGNWRKFGHCRFGEHCLYAHKMSELENPKTSRLYKTVLCNVPICTRKFCAFAHGEAELRSPSLAWKHIPKTRFECLVEDNLVTHENLHKKYMSHFLCADESVRDAVDTVRAIRNIMSQRIGDGKMVTKESCALLLELLRNAFTCMGKAAGGRCLQDFEAKAAALAVREGPERKEGPDVLLWDETGVEHFFARCNFPTKGLRDNQVDGGALVALFQDEEREKNFCSSVEEGGLGFTKLLFKGRFKKEMALLGVAESK